MTGYIVVPEDGMFQTAVESCKELGTVEEEYTVFEAIVVNNDESRVGDLREADGIMEVEKEGAGMAL